MKITSNVAHRSHVAQSAIARVQECPLLVQRKKVRTSNPTPQTKKSHRAGRKKSPIWSGGRKSARRETEHPAAAVEEPGEPYDELTEGAESLCKEQRGSERGRLPVELTLVLNCELPAHPCSPRGTPASYAFVFRLNHQMATIDAGIPKTTRAHSRIRTMEPTT